MPDNENKEPSMFYLFAPMETPAMLSTEPENFSNGDVIRNKVAAIRKLKEMGYYYSGFVPLDSALIVMIFYKKSCDDDYRPGLH